MADLRRHLIAVLVGWLPVAGWAQAERPGERRLEFTVFSAQPITGLAYSARAEGKPRPLAFYPTARSPQYSYAGPATVQFLDARSGTVAAEVIVPPEIRMALFIFSPVNSPAPGAPRYQVMVVDDSQGQHAPGKLRVLNYSGLALSGTINRHPVVLPEGANGPFESGTTAVIELRTPFRDRSYRALATTLSLAPGDRGLLLLLPPYRPGSLEVQSRMLVDAPPSSPTKLGDRE